MRGKHSHQVDAQYVHPILPKHVPFDNVIKITLLNFEYVE